ncbi:hypothetical protein WA026_011411 [Henosepilachna vigintioctopunctata]|uniref:Trehalase n=1 Tax=Henosepilachna vigintioctopunctata TaxID=420089 RepID=A0AAW1TSS0_9CUCU
MYTTVRGMLDNYLYIVDNLGYVPNGGRIYYLGRSQPPLLIPSFKLYMDTKNDLEYLRKSIIYLEQEFSFWLNKRTVQIKVNDVDYILAHYGDDSEGPRPESYAEDVKFASSIEDPIKKAQFYNEVKAACESGWDFSSRWFQRNDSSKGHRLDISTSSIIPVDLNAILYGNAVILQKFHEQLGNSERAEYYKKLATQWLEAVTSVLWDKDVGVWLDFDTKRMERINFFHASNLTPLWTRCFDETIEDEVVELTLKYLEDMDILSYPGGIPQTLECTGEQWDFPNAWPPSQHILFLVCIRRTIQKLNKLPKI